MSAPDWVGDLLHMWAAKDWSDAQGDLGFPSVSPMFARALGEAAEAEDVAGYSRAELRVTFEAVEWLRSARPELWQSMSRRFRPWTRQVLAAQQDDASKAEEAMRLIAEFIDKRLA